MAKNREPPKPVEPDTESGEEGDEALSEEDGSSDSESEPELGKSQFFKKPLPAPAATKKAQPLTPPNTQQPESSSEGEESGSESDSEGPNRKVKPLASKPMDSPQKSAAVGKPRSNPDAGGSSTPAKSTGVKRPAEGKEVEAKESKRSKKKPQPQSETPVKKFAFASEESKKLHFQRLWYEHDEISILEGMAEYAEKKKSDPNADVNVVLDSILKKLRVDVTRVQLQDKIRKLKKKYQNNKKKETEGKDMTFSKPHDEKAYELSNIAWGAEKGKESVVEKVVGSPNGNGSGSVTKMTSVGKVTVAEDGYSKEVRRLEFGNDELANFGSKRLISNLETVEERILRAGVEFFEGDKKLEGAREWRKLRLEELELFLKKLDLLRAQTKLVLDASKSTWH